MSLLEAVGSIWRPCSRNQGQRCGFCSPAAGIGRRGRRRGVAIIRAASAKWKKGQEELEGAGWQGGAASRGQSRSTAAKPRRGAAPLFCREENRGRKKEGCFAISKTLRG